ncbi:MAG TPA: coproporphyrinogen III oxidase [Alphaproteobacteria bacterium]|nr:coproporphyrinogen III oxidase [Alphaproteobacteria bacterium]
MKNLSIYVHWPWCKSKCPYCDFNSHSYKQYDEDEYIACVLAELDRVYANLHDSQKSQKVCSIYFGGGTPSLMQAKSIGLVIDKIKSLFDLTDNIEISTECNPTSAEAQKMQEFASFGVNRVSIGVQSLRNDLLKFLGREHDASEAMQAIKYAFSAVKNVNFDLIYGLPEQKLEDWQSDLDYALKVGTPHISCYQLTIEKNTAFYNLYKNNKLIMPNVDTQAEFFNYTRKFLMENGYENYEVSNFAKDGFECKHNVNIWQYNSYIGVGAGAHGRYINAHGDYLATQNIKSPSQYVKAIKEKGLAYSKTEVLGNDAISFEMLLLGLRLKQGVNLTHLEEITGQNSDSFMNKQKLDLFLKEGLLEKSGDNLRLTEKSYHLLNQIIEELLV